MSDISTFCPNNMNETRISQALLNAENAPEQITTLAGRVTSIEGWKINTVDPSISSLTTSLTSVTSTVNTLTTKVDNNSADVLDILNQIIWEGSINVLDLSSVTFTIDTQSADFTAELKNGVIIARKSAVTSGDIQFTISGIAIEAGDYYACIGDSLHSTSNIYQMSIYDDNNTIVAMYNNTDGSSVSDRGLTITSDITDGKIVFTLDKDFASNAYFKTVPIISETNNFDKDYAMPYFKPLVEVSGSE